jgi:UDP-N-acetylglucosamine:LPS N-acetylglucosamine transferase
MAINHEGWQADLLRETGAGLVLDAEDTNTAARKLVDALHDPTWLEHARKAAKQLAEERFARDRLAVLLEAVLQNATR